MNKPIILSTTNAAFYGTSESEVTESAARYLLNQLTPDVVYWLSQKDDLIPLYILCSPSIAEASGECFFLRVTAHYQSDGMEIYSIPCDALLSAQTDEEKLEVVSAGLANCIDTYYELFSDDTLGSAV